MTVRLGLAQKVRRPNDGLQNAPAGLWASTGGGWNRSGCTDVRISEHLFER